VQGTAVSCEQAPTAAPINTTTGAGIDQDTSIGSIFAAGDRSAPPLVSFVVREGDRDTDWDRVTAPLFMHARSAQRTSAHALPIASRNGEPALQRLHHDSPGFTPFHSGRCSVRSMYFPSGAFQRFAWRQIFCQFSLRRFLCPDS
jgi:hypothetical protein